MKRVSIWKSAVFFRSNLIRLSVGSLAFLCLSCGGSANSKGTVGTPLGRIQTATDEEDYYARLAEYDALEAELRSPEQRQIDRQNHRDRAELAREFSLATNADYGDVATAECSCSTEEGTTVDGPDTLSCALAPAADDVDALKDKITALKRDATKDKENAGKVADLAKPIREKSDKLVTEIRELRDAIDKAVAANKITAAAGDQLQRKLNDIEIGVGIGLSKLDGLPAKVTRMKAKADSAIAKADEANRKLAGCPDIPAAKAKLRDAEQERRLAGATGDDMIEDMLGAKRLNSNMEKRIKDEVRTALPE